MSTSFPPPLPGRQPPPLPKQRRKEQFTATGGLLVLLTAIVTLAFALLLPFWLLPKILPPHTRYPGLIIAIPTVVFGGLLFTGLAWITGKLGFPATKPKETVDTNEGKSFTTVSALPSPLPGKTQDPVTRGSHALLSLVMLAGVAAGYTKGQWHAIVSHDPDVTAFTYTVVVFAGLGIAGIACWLWYLARRPFFEFLGMNRSLWLIAILLAWLCGGAIGLIWRYI